MSVLLFEFLPSFIPVVVLGTIVHYMFKLIHLLTEEAKDDRTITKGVLCIIAVLILSILLILMTA